MMPGRSCASTKEQKARVYLINDLDFWFSRLYSKLWKQVYLDGLTKIQLICC